MLVSFSTKMTRKTQLTLRFLVYFLGKKMESCIEEMVWDYMAKLVRQEQVPMEVIHVLDRLAMEGKSLTKTQLISKLNEERLGLSESEKRCLGLCG